MGGLGRYIPGKSGYMYSTFIIKSPGDIALLQKILFDLAISLF
jgi:hypothetical protein